MYPFSHSRTSKTSFPILAEASEHFSTPDAGGNLRPSTLESLLSFLFKRSAKHLRTHLAAKHGVALSHGQSLDAVSACMGCADWNTANAHLQQLALEDQGGLGLARAQAAATDRAEGPWKQGHLRGCIDFNVSSAIVGASGTGKSVGLLFALQSCHDVAIGRPVMVIHGYESERYQPNWNGWLRHLPHARAWSESLAGAAPQATDVVHVEALSNLHDSTESNGDRETRRQALTEQLLQWLTRRAHLRPLLLVDEAYAMFGEYTGQFLAAVPDGVVVIWATQTLEDLYLRSVADRFDVVHLLSVPRGTGAWNALGFLSQEQRQRLERRMVGLPMGQAVTIPLDTTDRLFSRRQPPLLVTQGMDDLQLHARVLAVVDAVLADMQVQREILPNHFLPVMGWQDGKRRFVLEVKLRDKVLQALSVEECVVIARMRKPGAPVHGLMLVMLEALERAGRLVRQIGDTTVPATEALWNVRVGKLAFKGVLILEMPEFIGPGGDVAGAGQVVPEVTGPLFAKDEASARLRDILRAPNR